MHQIILLYLFLLFLLIFLQSNFFMHNFFQFQDIIAKFGREVEEVILHSHFECFFNLSFHGELFTSGLRDMAVGYERCVITYTLPSQILNIR